MQLYRDVDTHYSQRQEPAHAPLIRPEGDYQFVRITANEGGGVIYSEQGLTAREYSQSTCRRARHGLESLTSRVDVPKVLIARNNQQVN